MHGIVITRMQITGYKIFPLVEISHFYPTHHIDCFYRPISKRDIPYQLQVQAILQDLR